MLAFPTYIFDDDSARFVEGALLSLPAELSTKSYEALYRKAPPGWHVCGAGYWYYAFRDDSEIKYVIAGVVLSEERPPKKKFYFPPLKLKRSQIEILARGFVSERNLIKSHRDLISKEKDAELGMLIHDLRTLSTAILHAGEEARRDVDHGAYSQCRTRIENILATQTLLSIRIDGLDFEANPLLFTNPSRISVFRKVDKVVRSLRPRGNTKHLRIEFDGNSFGTVLGPDVFELVPFAILDNAIKYSPAEQQIDVTFQESDFIEVKFRSIGPKIDLEERDRIFEKHYRGMFASATGVAGTGIGLNMVYKLVTEYFGGRILVNQSALRFQMNAVPYHDTEFTLQLPRST